MAAGIDGSKPFGGAGRTFEMSFPGEKQEASREESRERVPFYIPCAEPHQCRIIETPPSIEEVKKKIRSGNAADLLCQSTHCCTLAVPYRVKQDMGTCIYQMRGTFMKECSCACLNRKEKPLLRSDYEEIVIEEAFQYARKNRKLTITFFAPGYLFGELVLLIKLLDRLEKEGWQGDLNLRFIDKKYPKNSRMEKWLPAVVGVIAIIIMLAVMTPHRDRREQIEKEQMEREYRQIPARETDCSEMVMPFITSLGVGAVAWKGTKMAMRGIKEQKLSDHEKAIISFKEYLDKARPADININTEFAPSMDDLLELTGTGDLLVGVDTGGGLKDFKSLIHKMQRQDGKAIILLPQEEGPKQAGIYFGASTGHDSLDLSRVGSCNEVNSLIET